MWHTSKYIFLLLFSVFSFSFAQAGNEGHAIIVEQNDGTLREFNFSDKPVVLFDNGSLTIKTSSLSVFDFSKVSQVFFSAVPSTDIKLPKETFHFTDNGDFISSDSHVSVYTLNGMKVPLEVRSVGDGSSFSFSSLPSGIYIIRLNNKSFKIRKK